MPAADGTFARWRARAGRAFFGNFFALFLIAISVSQWGVLWWVFPRLVNSFPVGLQVGGPVALFLLNRRLAARIQRRRRDRLPESGVARVYYALAFTSLFCAGVLLLVGTLWMSAKFFVGAIAAQAWTARAGMTADLDVDLVFRWLGNAGVAFVALMFGYGYSIGQLRLKVRRLALPVRTASTAVDGLRIAQISDIHIGQNLDRDQLERFVARVNELQADLVCITGDIADSQAADLDGFLPMLAQLRARHGVIAILGNHDHHAGADHVEAALRRLTPFTVLRDDWTSLDINGARLHVVGLDDRGRDWARGVPHVPDLDAMLAAIPRDEPVLLLCHRPDIFPQAAAAGVVLTLSGHTHGGQLAVPWFKGRARNLAEFITAFDRGLFERDGCYLYVNSGLGVTAQRIRLNAPREITLIELQASTADELAA
jgi:predicted MPP superfamily phosphohydrolase